MSWIKQYPFVLISLVLGALFVGGTALFQVLLAGDTRYKALQEHVQRLSADSMQGRFTGSPGEKLATEYVAAYFKQLGLEPAGDKGSYFQEFDCSSHALKNTKFLGRINRVSTACRGRNVLARLSAGRPHAQSILIGAHGDHLGLGQINASREPDREQSLIHNGADDNASGVAAVLEAASELKQLQDKGIKTNKDIVFAVWSGEEVGLLGSSHFIASLLNKHKNKALSEIFAATINLDMVGRLRENLIIQGVGSSPDWKRIIAKAQGQRELPILLQKDPYLPTDSLSFYLQSVPGINLFTGSHDEYHTSADKEYTLNYAGLDSITEFLVAITQVLDEEPQALAFRATAKPRNYSTGGLKVYLGTIPDYSSADQQGIKLSGVTKGSPAEKAGIKAKDIILELAGKPITDLYAYTEALNTLPINKAVKVAVLREERVLHLAINPQKRG